LIPITLRRMAEVRGVDVADLGHAVADATVRAFDLW
jgi:hypothetical protein